MKSLITAISLILTVIALVVTDYFVLNNILDYTNEKLDIIIENMDENEMPDKAKVKKIENALDSIEKKWKKSEDFICLSLRHNVGREFALQLVPAISYFKSEEYPDFMAQIMTAKDTIDHIKYDEGLKIGNIL